METDRKGIQKIGVLADTHVGSFSDAASLAECLLGGPFADIDAILHAGDHVLPELESFFYPLPWYAVRGNMDSGLELPQSRVVSIGGYRIGLTHGWGVNSQVAINALGVFADKNIHILVFGHTHAPCCRKEGSILLLNPGSPTDRRSAPFYSVGILELGNEALGRIVSFENPAGR